MAETPMIAPRNDTRTMPRPIRPLEGRYATGPGVVLSPIAPRHRVSLRAGDEVIGRVNEALGLELPRTPKTSTTGENDGRRTAALWLGPDEWLVIADIGDDETGPMARLSEVAGLSAVDVSHRNTAILVEGPAAEAVLCAGCPQDIRLRSIPVGSASRTLLSKAEIVLWRTGETRFEVECWRSFSDYVWMFLEEASRAPAL